MQFQAQGPVSTGPPARRSACAHDLVRDAESGTSAVRDRGGEDRRHDPPPTHPPSARRSCPSAPSPRSDGDASLDRAAPVGVLASRPSRCGPSRAGSHVVRAVLGEAEDRRGGRPPPVRVEAQRRRIGRRSGRAQDREVVVARRTRSRSASMWSPSPSSWTVVSSWPATTWAFVTTTPSPATQPVPWTPRPHAVPSTLTTLLGRAPDLRVARDRASSAADTSACGPVDLREGVEARERLDQRA